MPPASALMIAEPGLISSHVAQAWLESGNRIAAIWGQSRRLARPGIGQRLAARAGGVRALGDIARRHEIPVRQVDRLSGIPDLEREIRATGADTLLTVMTLVIVPGAILDLFGRRAVNVHPALLPKYGGPNPVLSLLYDGKADLYGGITFHRLTPGIDEGPIVAQRALPWSQTPNRHAWDLVAARAAGDIARNELMAYLRGDLEAVEQDPAERHYRRVAPDEFAVTKDKRLAEVTRLLTCCQGSWMRWVHDDGRGTVANHAVYSLGAVLGPPTGREPVIGLTSIEADIADARIRMRRRPVWRATLGQAFIGVLAHRIRTGDR